MEQSSRHTATTRRRTRTVQTSFKDIFVLRGCSALVTLSAFNALCINLLIHSLTHAPAGCLYSTFWPNISKNFSFKVPIPLSLHRWG